MADGELSPTTMFLTDLSQLLAGEGIVVQVHTESRFGLTIDAWRVDDPGDVAVFVVGTTDLSPFNSRRVAAQIRARLGR